MITIEVTGNANADWLKNMPGYKNEVALLQSLKFEEVVEKGGPGSGNWGHAGRIGKLDEIALHDELAKKLEPRTKPRITITMPRKQP